MFADRLLCGSDIDAEEHARTRLDDFAVVELWDAGRLVRRLGRTRASGEALGAGRA